jgi:hypothetical protein
MASVLSEDSQHSCGIVEHGRYAGEGLLHRRHVADFVLDDGEVPAQRLLPGAEFGEDTAP